MDMSKEAATDQDHVAGAGGKRRVRERSQIAFPYTDLENAVELVRTLHVRSSPRCEVTQLATWLGQTATGGTFRTRLGAAKLFGLVETDRGFVSLAELGFSVLDQSTERSARVSAFLNAPLYQALYERFEGHQLPPAAALERQITALGVSDKQKERARQTFIKSANYAGFVDQQSGRLIKPGVGASDGTQPGSQATPSVGSGGGQSPPRDPLIEGLFQEVPSRGTEWSAEDQVRWFEAAAHVFALVFKRRQKIRIELVPDNEGERS